MNRDFSLFISTAKQLLFLFSLKTNTRDYEVAVRTNLNGVIRWPGTTMDFIFPAKYRYQSVIFKHTKYQIDIYFRNKIVYKFPRNIFLNKSRIKVTECITIPSVDKSSELKIKRYKTIPELKSIIIPHDVLRVCSVRDVFHGIYKVWPEAKRSILKFTKQIIFTEDGDSDEMWANTNSGLYLGTTLINTGRKFTYLDIAEIIIHENEHHWYGYLRMLNHDFPVEKKPLKTPWGKLFLDQLINEVNAYMASTLFRLKMGISIKNRRDSLKLCNSVGEDVKNIHTAINILKKHERKLDKLQRKLLEHLINSDLYFMHLPEVQLLTALESSLKLKV